jgi:hypothetical protein
VEPAVTAWLEGQFQFWFVHFRVLVVPRPKAEQDGRGNGDKVSSRGRRPSRRASPQRSRNQMGAP